MCRFTNRNFCFSDDGCTHARAHTQAVETDAIGSVGTLKAKVTQPLNITYGHTPPIMLPVPGSSTTWFFDFQSDNMGGIQLTIPKGAVSHKFATVELSEELDGPYGSGQILYPMRTGNLYRHVRIALAHAHALTIGQPSALHPSPPTIPCIQMYRFCETAFWAQGTVRLPWV